MFSRRFNKNNFTKGYIDSRLPLPSKEYDLDYFLGNKKEAGIQYYNTKTYLNPESKIKYKFIDILKLIHTYLPSGNILDIGSGPGHLTYWSKKLGYDYNISSCDISNWLEHSEHNHNDNFTLRSATQIDLYTKESFNCIVYSDVLEHITPEEALLSLKKAHTLLQSGGLLLIKIPNRITWDKATYVDKAHLWLPSTQEMRTLMNETKFTTIKVFTRGFPFSSVFFSIFKKDLRLPAFGNAIYVIAKK